MIRNIANVVHDLEPIVRYLKQKALSLPAAETPEQLMSMIEKIQADALMLERYLDALAKDAKAGNIHKNNVDQPV